MIEPLSLSRETNQNGTQTFTISSGKHKGQVVAFVRAYKEVFSVENYLMEEEGLYRDYDKALHQVMALAYSHVADLPD